MPEYDAVIVGAGPNGLAAGIVLARTGWKVLICEAKATIGGGVRSTELTAPGFIHDNCSAIHPLGVSSPFFKSLPLRDFGLEWIFPDIQLAHPFEDRPPALLYRSVEQTGATLDSDHDAQAYQNMMGHYVRHGERLLQDILAPLGIPSDPFLMGRFGLDALQPLDFYARHVFKGVKGRALLAGLAAHCCLPLDTIATASFGLVLGLLGHYGGWAIPKGGSQSIVNAMAAYFQSLGGTIVTETPIHAPQDIPAARAILLNITPRQIVRIFGDRIPPRYRTKLETYRYGAGSFKMDFALNAPVPWKEEAARQAGTLHLGATLEEIVHSEWQCNNGQIAEKPYVIVAQQSLFDPSRAPEGKHTLWAYCHVPHASTVDMSERIIQQIERFAPGFRETVITYSTVNAVQMEQYNNNYVGGDINGGMQDIAQLFTRPVARVVPYSTPMKGVYICSSSTPPGGGVHGMCGYHAARAVLRDIKL